MPSRNLAFELFLPARPALARRRSESFAGEAIEAARIEYERVRLEVPDIGGARRQVERGPDGEISLVFDECAANKWLEAQDVRELKPYCNFVDVTYSRLMGMGIDATETIGLGCDRCALRYKRGRETAIPPGLEEIFTR